MDGQTPGFDIYEEEHRLFRKSFRGFVDVEIAPNLEAWDKAGIVPRDLWRKAGEQGFLCMDVPEEYGGPGIRDFRFNMAVGEELMRVGASGVAFTLHTDIIVPYISAYGTEAQKKKYLPKCVTGECITAIAMSEPGAGSDLAGIATTAIANGTHYLVNGQKTFISNGLLNDIVIVAAKTDPTAKHSGMSLIVVEEGMEGYVRGRKLEKIGMLSQDTSELFFHNVKVPKENLLGAEGKGFVQLMQQLPQERLSVAGKAIASAETALDHTVKYCKERTAFGKPIGTFQHSRFKLAEMKTEVTLGRHFVNQCALQLNRKQLTTEMAAMAKWWSTELLKRTADTCLQLHGGYGYMKEYPIARIYLDARVQTILGGSTEIMKEIVGRSLGV